MGGWAGSVGLVLALGAAASTTWGLPGRSLLVVVLAVASGVALVAGLAVALVMEGVIDFLMQFPLLLARHKVCSNGPTKYGESRACRARPQCTEAAHARWGISK